jgi:SnoaL-like domain
MHLDELARHVQELEDSEAIKQLKARYCLYVDSGEPDKVADLFIEQAVWDGGVVGRYEGREAIRTFMRNLPHLLSFALHYVTNPHIEIHGDRATGQWYLLEPCTMVASDQAVWGTARYEDRYVKVGGEWKFAEVTLVPAFWTPFTEGWVKTRSVLG